LIYYLRNRPQPVYIFPPLGNPSTHFEMSRPLSANAPEPILAIVACSPDFERDYQSVKLLGPVVAESGPHSARTYIAYLLAGKRGPTPPARPCG
jgi:hypothetical protein